MLALLRFSILTTLVLCALSGCAGLPYNQVERFATIGECEVAHRLGEITKEALLECIISKPEAVF